MEMEIHQAAGGGVDEQQICRRRNGKNWRCKNVSGDNQLHYCEHHYKIFTNEQFCCLLNKTGWRCKNLRMGHGDDLNSVPKIKYCQKHFNDFITKTKDKFKDITGEEIGITAATGPVQEIRVSETKKEDDWFLDVIGIQPPATTSDTIIEGGSGTASIGRKRKNVEITERSGEPESLAGIRETVVELESLEHYKSKCFELSVELEKKKLECTTLQGRLTEVEKTRMTAATDETEQTPMDPTESWRKMFPDLESQVAECLESGFLDFESLMENRISTMVGCVESRISKLESLVLRIGKEKTLLRCVQLRDSEKIESEEQGSRKDVTQSGEKQRDENSRSKPSAEINSGGRKDCGVYKCQSKEKELNVHDVGSLHLSCGGENVEEGKDWGCSEERPSQHEPSQNHLEMSTTPFLNLVSDDDSVEILGESEDSDCSTDSEHSLGTLMDMLAMKYRNRNEGKENKWKCEADMISSFEDDHELCMKAVCALYRQQISGDEMSDKGLLHNSDALRCTTLGKFLMDGGYEGDLKKSVKELEIFDSKAVEDCKRLARRYSSQLFSIYQNGKDAFFLPATTASHGDEIAK